MTVWKKYIEYLRNWIKEHEAQENEGMSPACYDEWYDNEYQEEEDE